MAGNIFQAGAQGFNDANQMFDTIRSKRAAYRAAPMVAKGNFAGAAQEYGAAGMPDEARQSVADQQTMDDRTKQEQAAQVQQRAQVLTRVAQTLKTVPEGQRVQALQQVAPLFSKIGMDPSVLGQLDENHLTNQSLDLFTGELAKQVEQYTLQPGAKRYDANGRLIAEAPFGPQYKTVGEGQSLVQVGDGATPPAAPGPATSASGQPRGLRNNNPLNVTALPNGQTWDGQTGSDGKYATFSTPEAGLAAADRNLQTYATAHGINTIAGVIQRWAPPSENDTQSYIQTVAQDLGVDPNQPIDLTNPQNRQALLRAMAKVELGKPLPSGAQPAPEPSGARVIAQGPPKAPKGQYRPATAEEKAAFGIPADTPAQIGPDGKIDPLAIGNGRGTGKLAPQDSKYIAEARTAAQQTQNTVALVKRFVELNKEVGTGGIMGSNLFASGSALVDPRVAEMKSITDRLTPAMRQGMPGAASDRDVAMFQSATVGLKKPGPANVSVANAITAAAKRQQDYVAYLEDYARKNGSLLGAQEEWDAYAAANPMFEQGAKGELLVKKQTPWRQFFGGASTSPAADSGGGLPPQARAKLKPGHNTTFANGQTWTLQNGQPVRVK